MMMRDLQERQEKGAPRFPHHSVATTPALHSPNLGPIVDDAVEAASSLLFQADSIICGVGRRSRSASRPRGRHPRSAAFVFAARALRACSVAVTPPSLRTSLFCTQFSVRARASAVGHPPKAPPPPHDDKA